VQVRVFKPFSVLLLSVLILTPFSGCREEVSSVDFMQLINLPPDYNNKLVAFDAFYFSGFEIQALAGALSHPAGSSRWMPDQPLIWITGNIPQNVIDQLHTQTDTPSGYTERFGKIRVTGKFEFGGKYGQLDSYLYRLTATDASILDWNP
jgi:hypothetical protein